MISLKPISPFLLLFSLEQGSFGSKTVDYDRNVNIFEFIYDNITSKTKMPGGCLENKCTVQVAGPRVGKGHTT